jgi:PilZ domain-containing protein
MSKQKQMRHVNRRESHRVEIKLRCYVTSPAVWSRGAMHIENISRGGLLLAWRSETGPVPTPSVGQIITIEVELPANHGFGPKCIHCQGAVARIALEDRDTPRVAVRLNYMDFRSFPDRAGALAPTQQVVSSWTA